MENYSLNQLYYELKVSFNIEERDARPKFEIMATYDADKYASGKWGIFAFGPTPSIIHKSFEGKLQEKMGYILKDRAIIDLTDPNLITDEDSESED